MILANFRFLKMKYYFHKQFWQSALFSAVFVVGLGYLIVIDDYSWGTVVGFIFSVLFLITSLILLWRHRTTKEFSRNAYDNTTIVINEDVILFPKGYYFRQSSIHKERRLPASRINELVINTYPTSIVIDNKEVIFLKSELKEELVAFANRNNIPISDRVDIWSYILEPFLDTEMEEDEKVRYIAVLAKNGVPPEETKAIRRKVGFTMLVTTYYGMEWMYYGQFDYLTSTVKTKSKYWWTMEIALRNYRSNG